ncbi:ATP-binding protein [Streptomyces cacaoi]|uniref:ATP-binding protein n=1 Tax=Streptomyces cacaoi TaxID=1898 RepID=UPI003748DADA
MRQTTTPHERPGRTDQVPRLTAAFPATRQQVPRMRQIARGWLERWALPAVVVGDAELVVSELGTNAVEHGRGPVGLTLAHLPGVLRIEVIDRSSTPARPRTVAADAESGRGLLLVDALAGAWGVSPDGTVTWAELPVADDEEQQRAEPAGGRSPGVTSTFQ